MEEEINDAGGAIFASYTGSDMAGLAGQYVGNYMEGSYWTNQAPPFQFGFWPYTAVINMRDGTVIAMDSDGSYLSTQDILAAISSVE